VEKYFIIDFDGTITQVEALDELAEIALKSRPDREAKLKEIKSLTCAGMDGKISFPESLDRRMALFKANRQHVSLLIKKLRKKISKSFLRNRKFFRLYGKNIYIISGGFREYIVPILKPFGVPEENIYANTFRFGAGGFIIGADRRNLLTQEKGKAKQLKALNLKGDICILGDGYTDYEMKSASVSAKFFAFTENIKRESTVSKADHIVPSFDEFLYLNKLPMSVSYPKNRIKILLLENINPQAALRFKEEGFSVESSNCAMDENELAVRIQDAHVLGIRSRTIISDAVLSNAKKLITAGAFCVGTNNIDLAACTKRGIAVFNAPYSNTRSVAELVIGEIIMLLRGIPQKNEKLHQGIWDKTGSSAFEARGKKLGIIGYGNIGSQVSALAESLGMKVLFFDVLDKLSLGNAKKCGSMAEVLKKSDIITVHVDGNQGNINLIGDKEFRLMKDESFFLNLSRGNVVNLKDLAAVLKSGKLRGCAVDVFPKEPKNNGDRFSSPLARFQNALLTPHIGGSTREALENIAGFVCEKITGYINSGDTLYSVNFPQLKLPELKNSHRFLHIHKNVPGMLSQINAVFAEKKINIEGQYLKTNDDIGYVITDIRSKYDKTAAASLQAVPGTIKFRTLY